MEELANRVYRKSLVSSQHSACVCVRVCARARVRSALTMRCTDEGESNSALPVPLMNDLTFVLVTAKDSEGRAAAQNNAALVYLSASQALVSSYWGNSYP